MDSSLVKLSDENVVQPTPGLKRRETLKIHVGHAYPSDPQEVQGNKCVF